jgi:hypothetical protein
MATKNAQSAFQNIFHLSLNKMRKPLEVGIKYQKVDGTETNYSKIDCWI